MQEWIVAYCSPQKSLKIFQIPSGIEIWGKAEKDADKMLKKQSACGMSSKGVKNV